MRSGPLVRRGAKASRATQLDPYLLRLHNGRRFSNRQITRSPDSLFDPNSIKNCCVRLECRLPINLREFLAEQLGAVVDQSDATILNLAGEADQPTLSKLARAIRRYSTNRAHEQWEECTVALEKFGTGQGATEGVLCLRCKAMDFAADPGARHRPPGCIVLNLAVTLRHRTLTAAAEAKIADAVRGQIEEFRRLRAAFGLPHFELDSYIRHGCITFTWRPLKAPG